MIRRPPRSSLFPSTTLSRSLSGFFLPGNSLRINQSPTLLPPEPRLQVNPPQDFHIFYATQQAQLNSYGWNDRKNGTVHIPIGRDRKSTRLNSSHLVISYAVF